MILLNWVKNNAGEIQLLEAYEPQAVNQPVPANKVIRENAEHIVRVGESEKTSGQMAALLSVTEEKRSRSLLIPLLLLLVLLIMTAMVFYKNGFTPSAAANRKIVEPAQSDTTYKILR